jgi:NfeD-like C-terminal, partner-binding
MLAVYIASLLFGGLLIGASLLGAGDHPGDSGGGGGDVHTGDTGAAHDGAGHARLMALFGLRFWSFGAAFFGVTGLLLHLVGGAVGRAAAPFVGALVGVGAGLGASAFLRKMTRESIGRVADAAALVGREGRLLLPVERAQRGKVRLSLPAGGQLDLVAEGSDAESLPVDTEVLIVEVRGTVAVVARAPGGGHGSSRGG